MKKETIVANTMREFKEGKLRSSSGDKVTDRDQAIAIALSKSGQSKFAKGGYVVQYDPEKKKTITRTKKEADDFVEVLKKNGHTLIEVFKVGEESKSKAPATKSDNNDIDDALTGAKTLLKFATASDKKEIETFIKGLEILKKMSGEPKTPKTEKMKTMSLSKDRDYVKEAKEYFIDAGFIDELNTDERFYVEELIKSINSPFRTEKEIEAEEYFIKNEMADQLTKDKQFYVVKLIDNSKKKTGKAPEKTPSKKEEFVSTPIKEGQIYFDAPRAKPGYYNNRVIKSISGKYATVQATDVINGEARPVGNPYTESVEYIQNLVDQVAKEKFDKDQQHKKLVETILDEIDFNSFKGGDLNSFEVQKDLLRELNNLKTYANKWFSTSDRTQSAGYYGSTQMYSTSQGAAINLSFNNIHRGGYYGFDRPYFVNIQIGGALEREPKRALEEVAEKMLEKYTYESDFGKSKVGTSSGTAYSSVFLISPSKNSSYRTIPFLSASSLANIASETPKKPKSESKPKNPAPKKNTPKKNSLQEAKVYFQQEFDTTPEEDDLIKALLDSDKTKYRTEKELEAEEYFSETKFEDEFDNHIKTLIEYSKKKPKAPESKSTSKDKMSYTKKEIIDFVDRLSYFKLDPNGDDQTIIYNTRKYGNVGSQTAGQKDLDAAERIKKEVESKFPGVKVEYGPSDEYVDLGIMLPNPKSDITPTEKKPSPKETKTQIIDFVEKNSWFELDDDSDDFMLFATRENGNVGSESPGSKDIAEAKRLKSEIEKKFEGLVKIELEVVDEWVHINIDILQNKFASGGVIGQEIVFDDNGEENKGVIKDIHEITGDYIVATEDGRTVLASKELDVISLGAMRKKPLEAARKRFGFFKDGGIIDYKKKQLDIINRTNPAPNNINTWIRSVDDIKTAEEVFSVAFEEGAMYPDFQIEDMQEALDTGFVTIYSSYPIKPGVFVTPSAMNATDYAGGNRNKIHSKKVKLNEIAWIDESEGQYAPVNRFDNGGSIPKTETILWAVKIGEPDWKEQIITTDPNMIEPAKKWAMANGFDRLRIVGIDMSSKPDFTKTFRNGGTTSSKYEIVEGYNHYKNIPLYRVTDRDEYVGEWHSNKSDAEKELFGLKNKFKDGGNVRGMDWYQMWQPKRNKVVKVGDIVVHQHSKQPYKIIELLDDQYTVAKLDGNKEIEWKTFYEDFEDHKMFMPQQFGSGGTTLSQYIWNNHDLMIKGRYKVTGDVEAEVVVGGWEVGGSGKDEYLSMYQPSLEQNPEIMSLIVKRPNLRKMSNGIVVPATTSTGKKVKIQRIGGIYLKNDGQPY